VILMQGMLQRNRMAVIDRRLSIAPMMDWTTRDFRYLVRLVTKHTLLYTEMVVAQAAIHGDRKRLLDFDETEHPLALQLGGSDPALLAEASRIAEGMGYDEVNLNVGCPSDRVQKGKIGAVLMAEPDLVAECVAAMREAVSIPVTVKTRIGIDDQDDYAFLHHFVSKVHAAGCRTFIVHARKAVLSGLSPKENREIPPLIYQRGADVKRDFPECEVLLNGGIKSLSDVVEHLRQVDGVMIGREAYQNPWFLAQADTQIFGCTSDPLTSQQDIVKAYLPYLQQRHAEGLPVSQALRHLLGLFQGQAGARQFRRFLSENMHKPKAAPEILLEAVAHL
jgi:tRNA-dihydrouridine synthase A